MSSTTQKDSITPNKPEEKKDALLYHNFVFNSVNVLVYVGSAYLAFCVNDFQTDPRRTNTTYPNVSDLLIAVAFMPLLIALKQLTTKLLMPLCNHILQDKFKNENDEYNYNLGKLYQLKLTQNFYKVAFYIYNVCFGYYVLKDFDFFPHVLGGSGDFDNLLNSDGALITDFYKPKLLKYYYLITLAHNLTDITYLVFIYETQTDFPLMFLHHSCTISLISFSYLCNYMNMGAIVIFLHDFADIVVYYCKSIINTRYKGILFIEIPGIMMIFVFIYTRLFVLGKLILHSFQNAQDWNVMYQTLVYFLVFLYGMHIYWFWQIFKRVFGAVVFKEYKDTATLKYKEKEGK